jgi:hypothetical protein
LTVGASGALTINGSSLETGAISVFTGCGAGSVATSGEKLGLASVAAAAIDHWQMTPPLINRSSLRVYHLSSSAFSEMQKGDAEWASPS